MLVEAPMFTNVREAAGLLRESLMRELAGSILAEREGGAQTVALS